MKQCPFWEANNFSVNKKKTFPRFMEFDVPLTLLFVYCHSFPYIILYHIVSYHIISYHIISYHIISYHHISYHIISYYIILYYIILYYIILYYIILYYIILYYIILYYIEYKRSIAVKRNCNIFQCYMFRFNEPSMVRWTEIARVISKYKYLKHAALKCNASTHFS